MENFTYTNEQITEILQLLNTIPVTGVENAMKITRIFNILNTPEQPKTEAEPKTE